MQVSFAHYSRRVNQSVADKHGSVGFDGRRAPALECARCHALVLDEDAAGTDSERDSVKLAKAVRAAIGESGGSHK